MIAKPGNNLFPVFLKLENFRVLIVGGGKIVFEKITAVLNNSPLTEVTLVAENILPELKVFALEFPNVKVLQKRFEISDFDDKDFVISAVNDITLSKQITELANERKILI